MKKNKKDKNKKNKNHKNKMKANNTFFQNQNFFSYQKSKHIFSFQLK